VRVAAAAVDPSTRTRTLGASAVPAPAAEIRTGDALGEVGALERFAALVASKL
jgi:hypothetical protein